MPDVNRKLKGLVVLLAVMLALILATSGEDQIITGTCAMGLVLFIALSWVFRNG
jgi:hypothetical protein